MNHPATRAALNTYAANVNEGERREPRHRQAQDLITDLLLMFEPDVAAVILASVMDNLAEEQPDTTPVYRNV
ncbi:hypothetical protein ACIA7S_28720 [Streptomyces sp. NPDC051643]|uniref:hypothetical protein n=1 Tax=Streptomyces sp. NPDC051643 TaxID=3365665 RepID=UPI00378A9013